MPVSLSEWRVRIGTFIHRIREYEVKGRKERLLKERIRRLKVLCERLEAKIGDSGEESEDDKSRQDGPDRKGCPHKTLNIRSSGNSSDIKDLLTSCDQCVQDLLLASDSHIKELLTPSDTCIKQLLTPRRERLQRIQRLKVLCERLEAKIGDPGEESEDDKSRQDGLDPKGCPHKITNIQSSGNSSDIKDLLTSCDQCIQELLTASHSHIKEILTPSDTATCIKRLLTPTDSNIRHLLSLPDSCRKDQQTACDSHVKDLTVLKPNYSHIRELIIHSDSCFRELHVTADACMLSDSDVKDLLTSRDSCIQELLTPTDSYIQELVSVNCPIQEMFPSRDSYTSESLTIRDSYIKELLTQIDSYTCESPRDSYIRELLSVISHTEESLSPGDTYIQEMFRIRDSYTSESLTTGDSCIQKLLTPRDSYIQELLIQRDSYTYESLKLGDSYTNVLVPPRHSYTNNLLGQSDSYINESLTCTVTQVWEGDSNNHDFLSPKDSYIQELLTPTDSFTIGSLTQGDSYVQELLTPRDSSFNKSPMPGDSYIQAVLTTRDAYTIGPITQGDSYVQELLTPRDSSFNKSSMPGDSYIQALLTTRDAYTIGPITQGDSYVQELLTPRDSSFNKSPTRGDPYIQAILTPRDSYTNESLTQGDSNNQDLLSPRDSYIRELLAPTDSYNIGPLTQGDSYVQELLTPRYSSFNKSPTPGDSYIQALLTPTDSCTIGPLTQGDSNKQDLRSLRDSYTRELLAPRDSYTNEPVTPGDSYTNNSPTLGDSYIRELLISRDSHSNEPVTLGDSNNQDLLSPRDSYIRELLAPQDSYTNEPVTPGDSYTNNSSTPGDSYIRELLTSRDSHSNDLLISTDVYANDPVTPGDSYTNNSPTLGDSYIGELLIPRDSHSNDLLISTDVYANEPVTPGDSYTNNSPTPGDSYIRELLTPRDSYTNESLTPGLSFTNTSLTLVDSNIQELFTPRDSHTNELLTPTDSYANVILTPGDSYIQELITPRDSYTNESLTPGHSFTNSPLMPGDSYIYELLAPRDSCTYEPLTPGHSYTNKSLTCVELESPRIGDKQISPPCTSSLDSDAVQHGPLGGKEMANTSSRLTSSCHKTDSLKGTVDEMLSQQPYLTELLLVKAGDVELNPGPLHGTMESVLQEIELVRLVEEVPGDCYYKLCNGLGFSISQSKNALTQHHLNFAGALIEFFSRWKVWQKDGTNCRALLGEILQSADMGAQKTKLLKGEYLTSGTSPSDPILDTSQPFMTEAQVLQCGEDLKTFYREQMCKMKPDLLDFNIIVEFKQIYTNLTLLRNEMGTRTKKPLNYTDLLTTKVNGVLPKRLLVEGEGGVGKTTFCSKIAWDWVIGSPEFQHFSWVLVIPLRNVVKGQTIGDIMKNYLADNNVVHPKQINNYIYSQPTKVLIVLDGLDEYDGDLSARENSDISQILRLEKCKECIVLVTTRPWRADMIKSHERLRRSYAFIGLEGFSAENFSTYISKYFMNEEKAGSELIRFIEVNDVIRENMAPFPIYVAMLCKLWENCDSEKRETICRLKTFSQLFEQMITFLRDHYVSKVTLAHFDKEMENIKLCFQRIGSIAFSGLLTKKLVYNEEDFSSCKEAMETCCRIGVLSRESRNASRWKRTLTASQPVTTSVFFPHKLFQEYIASVYIASLYDSNRDEYSRSMGEVLRKNPQEFRYLLYFTAALGREVGLDIVKKIQQNRLQTVQHGRRNNDFLADVTFEAYNKDTAKAVGQQIFADRRELTIDKDMPAHTISGYLFIMDQHRMKTLVFRGRSCGPTVSRDVADVLCTSNSLSRLVFYRTTLDVDFYQIMHTRDSTMAGGKSPIKELVVDHQFLNGLQKLQRFNNGDSNVTVEDLFPSLKQLTFTTLYTVSPGDVERLAHSSLAVLSIEHGEEGGYLAPLIGEPVYLGQLFSSSFPQLTCMTFRELVMGNIRSEAILHNLKNHLHLKSMSIISCFTDDELDPLTEQITAENRMKITLQHDMAQKSLTFDEHGSSTVYILDALCHRTCVRWLKIGKNIAGDKRFPDLHGREVDSKIQTLKVYDLNLRDDQSASCCLGKFTSLLSHLTDLELRSCSLHDDFYKEIADRASSLQIQTLKVYDLNLRDDQSASCCLGKFMSLLPHLTDLGLRSCSLHDDFYKEIADQASTSQIQNVCMKGICLEYDDSLASPNLARFLCALPCLTNLTITDSQESLSWFSKDFYQEIALQGPSSMNRFFNKKLHMNERSGELRQMNVKQQREYIGHLLHPTFSEITPRPTSKASEPLLVTPPELDVPSTSAQSDKLPEVPADIDTVIQEAIRSGTAPWNRSRIMVIGPAGVGKTSLIRRLTGQKFDPNEESTEGVKQDTVTRSTVSSWEVLKHAHTANDEIIQSIALDPTFGSDTQCSTGGEENRSDPTITERKGVELEHDKVTSVDSVSKVAGRSTRKGTTHVESPHTLDTPSTSSQQQMTEENVTSRPDHRHIAESDVGHVEELTESESPQNTDSNGSTQGKGNMSEAAEDKSSVKVLPTIAKISQGITREEITKVKSSALDITYSMWDFGGQEIYYITHPLFLSWRSLYILVIPLHLELSDKAPREEGYQEHLEGSAVRKHRTILELIHFWLMSVYTHAVPDSNLDSTYEPKILLIGTFAGKEDPVKKVTAKFQELKDRLGSRPYWKQVLSPMFGIDNQFSGNPEVNTIRDRIDGLIQDSEYMKVCKPTKWRTFLTEIEDSDQNSLTVTEARSTMKPLGINDDKVDDVLNFYHDIGHLIYHQGCELIVLKPQFLNNIVSNIITVIDDKKMEGKVAECLTDLKENGILSIELIQVVWEDHKGDRNQLDNIISMMIMFDLICEIPNERPDGKRRFFVPCRSSPKLDEREIHGKDEKVEFVIDFHRFLPDGFLHQFYVRMAQWSMKRKKTIEPTFHCKEMVFYIDNDHRVVMTSEIDEGHEIKLMIYVVVPTGAPSERKTANINLNTDLIDYLHETLEDLKKRWARRIQYSIGKRCPQCSKYSAKKLIPITDILEDPGETACCTKGCAIYVGDIQRAFTKDTTETSSRKHVSASQRPSASTSVDISPQDVSAAPSEASISKARVLSMDEQHEDKEMGHSEQPISAWMESGEGVKSAKFRPHECTTQPKYDEGRVIQPAHHISPPSTHQDDTPVENLESRKDLSDGTGIIRLEKHGIEVTIPPNEAYRAKDVTVEPILDIPPELVLKETEAIISVGLRMSPSEATFDIPVRVRMPHCGIFTKPEAVEVVTYYRKSASESFTAIPSTNGSLRCVVRNRDLDICMNHFSEIWIVAVITWIFIGKRVICTPYIPVSTPKNAQHVLFVHVRDENIAKGEVQHGYKAPITGEQFLVKWRSGGLKITCKESTPMEDELSTLQESEIRHLTEHKVMFAVDTRNTDMYKVILHFILKQSTTKQLLVPMHLEGLTDTSPGKTESAPPRSLASTSVDIVLQGTSAATGEASTFKEKPTDKSRDKDVDGFLKTVAEQIHKDIDIDNLGVKLGIKPSNIVRYIEKNEANHSYMGTLSMLRDWRDSTTESEEREQLKKALIAIDHQRLADLLKDDLANDARGDSQSKSQGSEEEGLLAGQPRKSKKKTNRKTDSTDEDDTTGDNQSMSKGFEDDGQLGPQKETPKKTTCKTPCRCCALC